MTFLVKPEYLINFFLIAAGIGICGLTLLQVSSSANLPKDVKRAFQFFFSLLILYISAHLARQIMDGLPGGGIRAALSAVTFIEFMASGFVTYTMSTLLLTSAHPEEASTMRYLRVLRVLVCVHAVLLVLNLFTGILYSFDAGNSYRRSPLYILSNLPSLFMLLFDVFLLRRYRDKLTRRVASAFWAYIIAPIAAIAIQSYTYGIQFIIVATVGAAVYMFLVIIREQNEQYEKQRTESSRLETELAMASSIQSDMLPNIFPAFPEREEFDIYASMDPAKEVGGDFYDYFIVDDSRLGMVIADVSGKGVPAALFMMVSKIVLQQYTMQGLSPKAALEAANRTICANNREEMFVTVWLGVLDIETGKLTAANAGHEYPVIGKAGKGFSLVKDPHGLVIGGLECSRYPEYEIQLEAGDTVFLYTDGVPEATDAKQELYGTERMLAALNRNADAAPEELLKSMRADVDAFVGRAPQFDDLTMLCLRYNGPGRK